MPMICLIINMGSCCEAFFQKEQIHTNESRLKLLESKVNILYRTENDHKFTYYLHVFDQHQYLQKILQQFKSYTERTQDSVEFSVSHSQANQQLQQFNGYMRQFKDQHSDLKHKIMQDQLKIEEEMKIYKGMSSSIGQGCMVKLQIQGLELIKGIQRICIMKDIKNTEQLKNKHEFLIVNRIKSEKVYRQLIFPTITNSKIKIMTDPIVSSITIDLEDIAKSEVICSVFNFKNKEEEFGFIAIRMQFVTKSQTYRKEKMQRLHMIEKQLKLCLQGKEGLDKLSEYQSESSSHRQTFISEHVSDYNNEYQI